MLRKVPVIVILGSTGTGKTKLSIQLAEKFGGEVISADSMQVYPDLDIVTAKATKDERKQVKHHLLDISYPKEPFTVSHYQSMALPIINNLLAKDKLPIIVGGTNYYIESLLWDILVNSPLKMEISTSQDEDGIAEFENQPSEILHNLLKQVDPVTADKLHPNNKRKIKRALEVFHDQGVPLSKIIQQQRSKPGGNRLGGPLRYNHSIILWLHCKQDVLNLRLNERINKMLQQGLITELRNFYEKYIKDTDFQTTKGVLQTIGLKEFLPYLEKYDSNHDKIIEKFLTENSYLIQETSESNEPEGMNILRDCLNELKVVTVRYSKKQLKWIKNRFLGYKDRQVPPVYKLDTSDVDSWDQNVYQPAVDIIESYISNRESRVMSLEPITHPSHGLNEETSKFCDVCKRHFVGEFQWILHLQSNKHKRSKEKLNKKKMLQKLKT